MAQKSQTLLEEVEAFLAETRMGVSYFGKKSAGNSEIVARLRANGRVWPETAAKIRSFIKAERDVRFGGHGESKGSHQEEASKNHQGAA